MPLTHIQGKEPTSLMCVRIKQTTLMQVSYKCSCKVELLVINITLYSRATLM